VPDTNGNGTSSQSREQVQPERPRRGPPFGNSNGFRTGSAVMKRAGRGKFSARQRRLVVDVARRLTDDLGARSELSTAQKLIIGIISKQVGRLDKMHRVHDRLLRDNPELNDKPGALSRIDAVLAPVEQRVISNLNVLGLKRIVKPRDIYDWQHGAENGDGENGDAANGDRSSR